MSREYLIVAAVVLLGLVALLFLKPGKTARSEQHQAQMQESGVVKLIAKDYGFEGPAILKEGLITFQMENHGQELHHATILKIGEGHSTQEFMELLKKPSEGPMPAWLTEFGGPNGVVGGDTANAAVRLDPGQYVWICFIPSADGVPHFAKGMVKPFLVEASKSGTAQQPTADLKMSLHDFSFEFPAEISAGKHTIMVENKGPQHHEFEIVKLSKEATLQGMIDWAQTEQGPPPPVKWIGGLSGTAMRNTAFVNVRLEPGDYALLCFLPDLADGKNHITHGMVQAFTVK